MALIFKKRSPQTTICAQKANLIIQCQSTDLAINLLTVMADEDLNLEYLFFFLMFYIKILWY